jgi:hypothetical protein
MKKYIYIILFSISLAFAGCTGGGGGSNISGMEMGEGLQ